jgi:prepilin-type N-terminal cleavage/methylation domain-containing protein
VLSTYTSSTRRPQLTGFTLIELLVGLAIVVSLAAALAPVWLSLERAGANEGDRAISFVQGRVAVARLERDLRLAGAAGCPFPTTCAILEALPSQVVLLERGAEGTAPSIIEWEIAKGSLMRRVGRCPASRPVAFAHSLYSDNKTMLEHLDASSELAYVVNGVRVPGPVAAGDLALVDFVVLAVATKPAPAPGQVPISTTARVGR